MRFFPFIGPSGDIPLILTVTPTSTVLRETLDLSEPIDTVRVVPASDVRVVLACTARCDWLAGVFMLKRERERSGNPGEVAQDAERRPVEHSELPYTTAKPLSSLRYNVSCTLAEPRVHQGCCFNSKTIRRDSSDSRSMNEVSNVSTSGHGKGEETWWMKSTLGNKDGDNNRTEED